MVGKQMVRSPLMLSSCISDVDCAACGVCVFPQFDRSRKNVCRSCSGLVNYAEDKHSPLRVFSSAVERQTSASVEVNLTGVLQVAGSIPVGLFFFILFWQVAA